MSFHLKPASKGLLFTGPLSAMATTLSRLPAAVVPPPLLLQPPVPTATKTLNTRWGRAT